MAVQTLASSVTEKNHPNSGEFGYGHVGAALPLIVSFSNDPWDSAVTGRQHVLGRLARDHRVIFVDPTRSLRAASGWSDPARWREQLRGDRSGARVLQWPVWMGESYKPAIERPLLRARRRRLRRLIERESDGSLPILYVWHPDAWPLVEDLPARLVCYHVYDHYELLSPGHQDRIRAWQDKLAARADVVICVSEGLANRFGGPCERVHVVPNGADVAHFGQRGLSEPAEIADLPHPRLMLVARLNGNYNYRLLREMVEATGHPLVIVGPRRGMPEEVGRELDELLDHRLVRWVGEQPFDKLPAFVAHCEVGLIPYRSGTASDFASPLKLFEYLAAGKGVVATDIEAIRPYEPVVSLATTTQQWSRAIEAILAGEDRQCVERRIELASNNSWDARVRRIESILNEAIGNSQDVAGDTTDDG